jgi:hypothetical protein
MTEFDNFQPKYLQPSEHDLKYGRPTTIRWNTEERKIIEEIKNLFNTTSDAQAVKLMMKQGYHVIQSGLAPEVKDYVFKNTKRS